MCSSLFATRTLLKPSAWRHCFVPLLPTNSRHGVAPPLPATASGHRVVTVANLLLCTPQASRAPPPPTHWAKRSPSSTWPTMPSTRSAARRSAIERHHTARGDPLRLLPLAVACLAVSRASTRLTTGSPRCAVILSSGGHRSRESVTEVVTAATVPQIMKLGGGLAGVGIGRRNRSPETSTEGVEHGARRSYGREG